MLWEEWTLWPQRTTAQKAGKLWPWSVGEYKITWDPGKLDVITRRGTAYCYLPPKHPADLEFEPLTSEAANIWFTWESPANVAFCLLSFPLFLFAIILVSAALLFQSFPFPTASSWKPSLFMGFLFLFSMALPFKQRFWATKLVQQMSSSKFEIIVIHDFTGFYKGSYYYRIFW